MIRPSSVLIVDDLSASRELLRDLLADQGYELLLAAGGAEALDLARAHAPDLILLDLMMPDIDGLQVCRELRADPRTTHVPVLIITALDDRRSRLACLEAGCDDFLTKPVDLIELRVRVHTIVKLNRYRLLLDEQHRFERLFELAPSGLLIVDAQGNIQLANPAMAELLGLHSPALLVGGRLSSLLAPDDQARCTCWLADMAARRLGSAQLAVHLVCYNLARRPVALEGAWIRWAGAPAVQIIVRDSTDRKRAEPLEDDNRRFAFEPQTAEARTAAAAVDRLPQQPTPPTALTPREREVLRLLTEGNTNRGIAARLQISPGTVKNHVEHIIAKLAVSDRTQAAVYALRNGLLFERS